MARPGEAERAEATRRLLDGLVTGADAHDLSQAVWDLHPKNDTFPAEIFLGIGAKFLDLAGVSADQPIEYEGLITKFLAECQFRGHEDSKVKFAILASAALRGVSPIETTDSE